MSTQPRWWAELTSEEVAALVDQDPVVVLPLAATEQHGRHLPLSTDRVIGEAIVRAALEALEAEPIPVTCLPVLSVGASLEHTRFPGTLSLSARTLEEVLVDLGASLAMAGVRRLVLANSHGGNRAVLDSAGLRLRDAFHMLVVKATYARFPRPLGVDLPDAEWRYGLHGGAVETAMMLWLEPDLVRAEQIADVPSLGETLASELTVVGPEGPAPFAWSAADLAPEGVVGDATRADAAMGEALVRHYGAVLADVIRDAARFPLERLADGSP